MKNFSDKAKLALSRMTSPGDKIVAAVSGGPDSVCLLFFLHEMRDEFGFELCLAHLDHMARGRESEDDARFVEKLGRKLGLRTFVEKIDASRERKSLKTSFQEAARILRLQFFSSLLKRVKGSRLALGHHADDQVETLLINLLRGSGMKGLSGMPEMRGAIIRPLIDCTRAEIEAYLKSRGLECRRDSSNAGNQYLRNRIRQELVPVLKQFNKNFSANLLETAKIIRDDDRCLDAQTVRLYSVMVLPKNGSRGIELDRKKFQRQSLAHQKRLVREAISNVQGSLRRISTGHINQIIELFNCSQTGKRISLPCSLIAVSRENGVEFRIDPRRDASSTDFSNEDPLVSTELVIPGVTKIGGAGVSLDSRLFKRGSWVDRENIPNRAFLDFDMTGRGVRVRFFRPGDRFVPFGMKGGKKLKSYFIDEKIPRESRRFIPILTTGADDIIWVYGERIADGFRVAEKTRNILSIEGDRDFQTFPEYDNITNGRHALNLRREF